jgi:hypothetical protein
LAAKWKSPTKAEWEKLTAERDQFKMQADHAAAHLEVTREHRNALMNDVATLTLQVRALQNQSNGQ